VCQGWRQLPLAAGPHLGTHSTSYYGLAMSFGYSKTSNALKETSKHVRFTIASPWLPYACSLTRPMTCQVLFSCSLPNTPSLICMNYIPCMVHGFLYIFCLAAEGQHAGSRHFCHEGTHFNSKLHANSNDCTSHANTLLFPVMHRVAP
jgi:hypothetical protein